MEEETREFLIRILNTISLVLLWMMINVFAGIYMGWGFFEKKPNWQHILFYIWFVASFVWLILHLKKKWKLK